MSNEYGVFAAITTDGGVILWGYSKFLGSRDDTPGAKFNSKRAIATMKNRNTKVKFYYFLIKHCKNIYNNFKENQNIFF